MATDRLGSLLSLFSGCGGLDLGFEQVGFQTALAYDIRTPSIASWNENFQSGVAINRDIKNLTVEQIYADYGKVFRPNGVIGGPPCQGFSLANRAGDLDDPRNKLVERFFDIIIQLHKRSPLDFFVMENVPAIVGKRGGDIIKVQATRLSQYGFRVSHTVLDAVDFGVPQSRKRFFIVGVRKELAPLEDWIAPEPFPNRSSVRDAIGHLPEPLFYNRTVSREDIPFHPNHWCMQPKSSKFDSGELSEGYVDKRSFKTLKWDAPSYTAAYGNREVHVHPSCKRRLSVLEAMIIQGFPTSFELLGTLSEQITQVSEAVPPPLAKAVAASVREYMVQSKINLNHMNCDIQTSYPFTGSSTG